MLGIDETSLDPDLGRSRIDPGYFVQLLMNIAVYMSGYTDEAVIRHGLEHDRIPFIEKPFRTQAIAGKVRHLLDAKRKAAVG